jgi:DNA processing protein
MGELAELPEHPATALDALTPVQQRVYEALPGRGARTLEEVAVGAGLAVPQAMGQLALLELEGLVRRDDGRWRLNRDTGGHASA